MSRARIAASLLALGCIPSISPAPAPQDLLVQGAPVAVIQAAARHFAAAEFEIVHSDAASGIIQARRIRGPHGNDTLIQCAHDRASIFASNLRSAIAMTVTATPKGDSSAVRIATVVSAAYPALTGLMARAENEKDCVSTGIIEARLIEALRSQ